MQPQNYQTMTSQLSPNLGQTSVLKLKRHKIEILGKTEQITVPVIPRRLWARRSSNSSSNNSSGPEAGGIQQWTADGRTGGRAYAPRPPPPPPHPSPTPPPVEGRKKTQRRAPRAERKHHKHISCSTRPTLQSGPCDVGGTEREFDLPISRWNRFHSVPG